MNIAISEFQDTLNYRFKTSNNFCQCGLELTSRNKLGLCTQCEADAFNNQPEDLEEQDSFCECGGYKLENLDVCEECL